MHRGLHPCIICLKSDEDLVSNCIWHKLLYNSSGPIFKFYLLTIMLVANGARWNEDVTHGPHYKCRASQMQRRMGESTRIYLCLSLNPLALFRKKINADELIFLRLPPPPPAIQSLSHEIWTKIERLDAGSASLSEIAIPFRSLKTLRSDLTDPIWLWRLEWMEKSPSCASRCAEGEHWRNRPVRNEKRNEKGRQARFLFFRLNNIYRTATLWNGLFSSV